MKRKLGKNFERLKKAAAGEEEVICGAALELIEDDHESARDRLRQLRAELVELQRTEPHHRKIGTTDAMGRPILLDEICRTCTSRQKCRRTSVAMADIESKIL